MALDTPPCRAARAVLHGGRAKAASMMTTKAVTPCKLALMRELQPQLQPLLQAATIDRRPQPQLQPQLQPLTWKLMLMREVHKKFGSGALATCGSTSTEK